MERCLILIKPDGLQRGLVGEIISRFERKGLKIIGLKMTNVEDTILEQHYSHLKDEPFFDEIKKFMKSAPIAAIALEGPTGAVAAVRILVGPTKGQEAPAGTIRGDFGLSGSINIVHASDSPDNGTLEVERFFASEELFSYTRTLDIHSF